MKIYIDVGCGQCKDMLDFYQDNKDFVYYGIDPSQFYLEIWARLPNINFINKAAWVYDGVIKFYQDSSNDPQGSTLIKAKSRENFTETEVECFDFSEWIKQFKNDVVYIDMDVEGAEYGILAKMIKDKTIKLVNKLIYENHAHKFELKDKESMIIKNGAKNIEDKLKELNIDFRHDGKGKDRWE